MGRKRKPETEFIDTTVYGSVKINGITYYIKFIPEYDYIKKDWKHLNNFTIYVRTDDLSKYEGSTSYTKETLNEAPIEVKTALTEIKKETIKRLSKYV